MDTYDFCIIVFQMFHDISFRTLRVWIQFIVVFVLLTSSSILKSLGELVVILIKDNKTTKQVKHVDDCKTRINTATRHRLPFNIKANTNSTQTTKQNSKTKQQNKQPLHITYT